MDFHVKPSFKQNHHQSQSCQKWCEKQHFTPAKDIKHWTKNDADQYQKQRVWKASFLEQSIGQKAKCYYPPSH